jgi:TolB-like protein
VGATLVASVASAAPVRVALLPIAVHSADDGSGYLSAGLAEMLSARLEQSGGLAVVRVPGQAVATSEVEKAVAAGRTAGADFVVFGAFTQFGAGASLDVQCAAVNDAGEARARRIFVQSGTLGEIIPKLDDLADKITRYMTTGEPARAQASPADGNSDGALDAINKRLDALERAVYTQPEAGAKTAGEAEGPVAGAAP